jgi:tetratricopeptide (TPR) repeat protein
MAYHHARFGVLAGTDFMATTQTLSRDPALEAHVFWFTYRRQIAMALGIIVLLGLIYGLYWLYTDRREGSAEAMLAGAHDAAGYQQVIDQYDNTPAGATAYLLLAEAQRGDGKYADSNATLQKFVDKHPRHELMPAARMGIASNLQALGKIDEAQAAYQRVAADYPKSYLAPMALISQVTILKTKGDKDGARRICETIVSQYRSSIWSNEAAQQLRELKPPMPPGLAPGLPGSPNLGSQPSNAPPPMLARPPSAPGPALSAPPAGAPLAPSGAAPKKSASPAKP